MNLAYSVEEGYRDLINRAERHIRTRLAMAESGRTNAAAPFWFHEWIMDLECIRARELTEPIREAEATRLLHAAALRSELADNT